MNQGVLFQVVDKKEYVKNGDSYKGCRIFDVYGMVSIFDDLRFVLVQQGYLNFHHYSASGYLLYDPSPSIN